MRGLGSSAALQPLLAFAVGLALALLPWADDVGQWWSLRADAMAAAQGEVGAVVGMPSAAASAASEAWPHALPADSGASSAVALQAQAPTGLAWLPVLQAHGLQLQTLQQSAPGPSGQRPSLSLTLQGRWRDWLALERQGHALLSAWVPHAWQVQALAPPAAPGQVQVQWQFQGQVQGQGQGQVQGNGSHGLGGAGAASATQATPTAAVSEAVTEARTHAHTTANGHAQAGAEGADGADGPAEAKVFLAAAALNDTGAQPESARSREAATPLAWRWLGVWQQDGVAHAVAQQGGRLQRLRPGQRLDKGAAP